MDHERTCLIIEDDDDIGGLIKLVLSKLGLEPHVATSGAEGLRLVPAIDPALITLDLGLPDSDGAMLIHALKNVSKAPVIVVSARPVHLPTSTRTAAVADAYVEKPFSPRELRAVASALLDPGGTPPLPTTLRATG
ncbi:response regulator transcription factor [Arthrobacter sp. M4]|uniref:response regulator transcription factor n=1 Tax=Arthrobacter sp. M4 TaxID=218160 RepID=UPI001CDC5557|nr:response regulator [Arthrobacter sp. M4]MCA4134530.1 response regulator [Arthrobacter sp. M4]